MTSRERIRAALNHEKPDVLPIDFAGHRSSGISAIAYNRLKMHLGYARETTKLYDVMQQLAIPEDFILDRLGGDVVQVRRLVSAFQVKGDRYKVSELPDKSPCMVPYDLNPVVNGKGDFEIHDNETGELLAVRPKDGTLYDSVRYYLEDVETLEELQEQLVLPVVTEEELAFIEVQARELYYNTDKALIMHAGCSVFEQGQQDFGYENWACHLLLEKEMVHEWAEKMTDAYVVNLQKMLDRVGKYLDVLIFGGDDLGNQIQPQLSPELYREMIKPYHKKIFRFVRDHYPGVKVALHSCGAIYDLIQDLIEAGVQVLNPVQISAKGMDPVKLKREFGKDLVFWGGGADMQQFVAGTSNIEDIYRHSSELIEIFNQDGGFVFNQCHNILDEVSPEKILAIYQAALDCREKEKMEL